MFFLWKLGYRVDGITKDHALSLEIAANAEKVGAHVKLIVADPRRIRLTKEYHDLILCCYLVHPGLVLQMKMGLKHHGLVLMESYTQQQPKVSGASKDLFLEPKQLLFFFKEFEILDYEETVHSGPYPIASILARKISD